jgi:hypothetical protein
MVEEDSLTGGDFIKVQYALEDGVQPRTLAYRMYLILIANKNKQKNRYAKILFS